MFLLKVICIVAHLFSLATSDFVGPDYYMEDAGRTDTWNYYLAETMPMLKADILTVTEPTSRSLRAPGNALKAKRENIEDTEFVHKLLDRRKFDVTRTIVRTEKPFNFTTTINYPEAAIKKLIGDRILEETTIDEPVESTASLTTSLVPWMLLENKLKRRYGMDPTRTTITVSRKVDLAKFVGKLRKGGKLNSNVTKPKLILKVSKKNDSKVVSGNKTNAFPDKKILYIDWASRKPMPDKNVLYIDKSSLNKTITQTNVTVDPYAIVSGEISNATLCDASFEEIAEGDVNDMIFGPYGLFGKYGPNKNLFGDGQSYGKGGLYEPNASNNYSLGSFRGQEYIGPDGKLHRLKFPAICFSTRCNDTYIKQIFTKHVFTGSTDPCGIEMMGRKGRSTTKAGAGGTVILTNATRGPPMKICIHPKAANMRVPCRTDEELRRLSRKLGYNVTDLTAYVRNYSEHSKRYKYGTRFDAIFVKGWTTTKTKAYSLDIPQLLGILSNLTYDYDMNLTNNLNETLLELYRKNGIPTCGPTAQTRATYYDFGWGSSSNDTVVAKCFFCGMQEEGIPFNSDCSDAFAQDFVPLIAINPQARGQLFKFRKYCRRKDIERWYISPAEPRSVYGRWTGGCSVRWIDLSGVYTQRTCRSRKRAAMGLHFVSKRMAKLEMGLSVRDSDIVTF